jgi:hypothetical protein
MRWIGSDRQRQRTVVKTGKVFLILQNYLLLANPRLLLHIMLGYGP